MKKTSFLILLIITALFSCKKDKEEESIPVDPYANIEINTHTPTGITNTTAQITSDLQELDLKDVSSFGHVWSTNQQPTTDLETKTVHNEIESGTTYTSELKGLERETTYYVRPYFISKTKKVYYGNEISFSTKNHFFRFEIDADYFFNSESVRDNVWMILYNENNELIEYVKLENGNNYDIEWPENPTETYNLHYFTFSDYTLESDVYSIDVNLNVSPQVFTFIKENPYPNVLDSTMVNVSNFNDQYEKLILQTKVRTKIVSENGSYYVNQHNNPDDLYISAVSDDGSRPLYNYFQNQELGANVNINVEDLIPMSDSVNISFPFNGHTYSAVLSIDESAPNIYSRYRDLYYASTQNCQDMPYYFPGNEFGDLRFLFISSVNNISNYMRQNKGTPPTEFQSINADYSIVNSSLNSFQLDFNFISDVDAVVLKWSIDNDINDFFYYRVSGPPVNNFIYQAPAIPQEFVNLNPELINLENFHLDYIYLNDFSLTNGYDEFQSSFLDLYYSGTKCTYLSKYFFLDHKRENEEMDIMKDEMLP
jgi:hypothetical protein